MWTVQKSPLTSSDTVLLCISLYQPSPEIPWASALGRLLVWQWPTRHYARTVCTGLLYKRTQLVTHKFTEPHLLLYLTNNAHMFRRMLNTSWRIVDVFRPWDFLPVKPGHQRDDNAPWPSTCRQDPSLRWFAFLSRKDGLDKKDWNILYIYIYIYI